MREGEKARFIFMNEDQDDQNLALAFDEIFAEPEFVKAEKNLTAMGFFTPSSNKLRDVKSKTVQTTRIVDGKPIQVRVTIAPAALYGLPITSDQDKYLALQKLIHDRRRTNEEIVNPITFTTAELMRVMGREVRAGKNYDDVAEWMRRMTATTIVAEQGVYLAGRKAWASDTFHVFDRSVSFGKELPDGATADRNFVWLSAWQLENINNNHVVPVDFETYRQLKNHIAKALVPLLQIWLFATARQGVFEKRYDELCQHLNIQQYAYLSQIRQTLGPALDELVAFGYLTAWRSEELAGERGYKIVLEHGPKYYQDRRLRMGRKSAQPRLRAGGGEADAPPAASPGKRAAKTRSKSATLVLPLHDPADSAGTPVTPDVPAVALAAPVPFPVIAAPDVPDAGGHSRPGACGAVLRPALRPAPDGHAPRTGAGAGAAGAWRGAGRAPDRVRRDRGPGGGEIPQRLRRRGENGRPGRRGISQVAQKAGSGPKRECL